MDLYNLAVITFVKEEFLPRQALAFADHGSQAPVCELHLLKLAALPAEMEMDGLAGYVDVIVAERGEPERIVLPCVVFAADPYRYRIKKVHEGSKNFPLTHSTAGQILLD